MADVYQVNSMQATCPSCGSQRLKWHYKGGVASHTGQCMQCLVKLKLDGTDQTTGSSASKGRKFTGSMAATHARLTTGSSPSGADGTDISKLQPSLSPPAHTDRQAGRRSSDPGSRAVQVIKWLGFTLGIILLLVALSTRFSAFSDDDVDNSIHQIIRLQDSIFWAVLAGFSLVLCLMAHLLGGKDRD